MMGQAGSKLHLQIHFPCASSMASFPFSRYFPFCGWFWSAFCLSMCFPKQQKLLPLHVLRPYLDEVETSLVVVIGFICQRHSPRRLVWCFLCLQGKYDLAFLSRSPHSSQTPPAALRGFLLKLRLVRFLAGPSSHKYSIWVCQHCWEASGQLCQDCMHIQHKTTGRGRYCRACPATSTAISSRRETSRAIDLGGKSPQLKSLCWFSRCYHTPAE